MLHIKTMTLGEYQTNTYIVYAEDSTACVIIDPGYEAQTILSKVRSLGLTVDAIFLTHGHFDHVGAVEEIVEATGCRLWMREADWSQPMDPVHTHFYPLANWDLAEVWFCEDAQEITTGGLTFRVLETPGHTWGSVCYLCENAIFTGDTLFAGACGRSDLPGGDMFTLLRSLRRLKAIDGDLLVCPGHGEASTLAAEKKHNPYLR